jgi:hypothetical protein
MQTGLYIGPSVWVHMSYRLSEITKHLKTINIFHNPPVGLGVIDTP